MANIERRRDDANVPGPAGEPTSAERFVRVVEQIAIDSARRERSGAPQPLSPQPVAPPPQQAGPTVIYINNASSGPAPQTPPPHSGDVHYHTTVHQVARGASRSSRKATSAFGLASVLLGVVACVACWTSGAESIAFPVGVLGVALGAVGWLLSILLGRTGASLPFAGALISAIGVGISVVGKDATQPYLDRLKSRAQDVVREGEKMLPADAPNTSAKPEGTPVPPVTVKKQSVEMPATIAPKPIAPALEKPSADAANVAARAQIDAAVGAVETRVATDNTYQTAKLIADEADAEVARLRSADKSGTPEMSLAAARAVTARARVKKLHDAAIDADPAVVAARQVLADSARKAP